MLAFFLLVYYKKVTIPTYLILALSALAILSLYARRALPWFGMAAAPALPSPSRYCQS